MARFYDSSTTPYPQSPWPDALSGLGDALNGIAGGVSRIKQTQDDKKTLGEFLNANKPEELPYQLQPLFNTPVGRIRQLQDMTGGQGFASLLRSPNPQQATTPFNLMPDGSMQQVPQAPTQAGPGGQPMNPAAALGGRPAQGPLTQPQGQPQGQAVPPGAHRANLTQKQIVSAWQMEQAAKRTNKILALREKMFNAKPDNSAARLAIDKAKALIAASDHYDAQTPEAQANFNQSLDNAIKILSANEKTDKLQKQQETDTHKRNPNDGNKWWDYTPQTGWQPSKNQ